LGAFLLCLFLCLPDAHAQRVVPSDTISSHEAVLHVGDEVVVKGVIAQVVIPAKDTPGRPVFLNMGRPYPYQDMTLVVWREQLPKSYKKYKWTALEGKEVCVTGKMRIYKNNPEIHIYHPRQIHIIDKQ
jgi:micrococcal nuclease